MRFSLRIQIRHGRSVKIVVISALMRSYIGLYLEIVLPCAVVIQVILKQIEEYGDMRRITAFNDFGSQKIYKSLVFLQESVLTCAALPEAALPGAAASAAEAAAGKSAATEASAAAGCRIHSA